MDSRRVRFDGERYLTGSPFKAMNEFRKEGISPQNNPERKPRPDSGFVVLIGGDSTLGRDQQLNEAVAFLKQHEVERDYIRNEGVDNPLLDLGVEAGAELEQAQYLPPERISVLGRRGM